MNKKHSLVLKKYGINPHVHTTKQLNKMTKKGLISVIKKLEEFIIKHAYEMYKSKLPRLKKLPNRKTKRKTKKIVGKIYYTKKGQPYKILASGKARFVKR